MYPIVFFSVLLVLLAIGLSCSTNTRNVAQRRDQWRPVWSDEFDSSGLPDPKSGITMWAVRVGVTRSCDSTRRMDNARVENGHLIIEARREKWEGRDYTSARLVTKNRGDWTGGRFEIRARVPLGRGT